MITTSSLIGLSSISTTTLSDITDEVDNRITDLTFDSASDINISSAGDLIIATDYLNTGGSIYLTATGDITNSNQEVNAADDIVMSGANIYNRHISGGNPTIITSGDTTYLTATGDILNELAEISSSGLTYVNAGGSITNHGGSILAGDILYLEAGADITNKAYITSTIDGATATNDAARSSNADNIRQNLEAKGTISSDGDLVMIAANDINNIASDISTTGLNTAYSGEAYIEATSGDVNIITDTLRNRTVNRW